MHRAVSRSNALENEMAAFETSLTLRGAAHSSDDFFLPFEVDNTGNARQRINLPIDRPVLTESRIETHR